RVDPRHGDQPVRRPSLCRPPPSGVRAGCGQRAESLTMGMVSPSRLELRLSAYADGQASEKDRQDIEELLVNDPHARSLYDALGRGSELGRRAFDDMLKEPVPLDLVRAIKNASLPRRAIRLPSP